MPDAPSSPPGTDSLLGIAIAWAQKTGWPTRAANIATTNRIYDQWLTATQADFATTGRRDLELLHDMLGSALSVSHAPEAVECMQILLLLELVMRGRREGVIKRRRPH